VPQDEVVIYCRASKDKTGAGLSVDGQEADCRDFAASRGLTVREVYRDNDITASGKKPRKQYRKMLADLTDTPATVLIWHTDRLRRHPAEFEEYITLAEKHGITTHAVRVGELDLSTPSGRLVARMLGAAGGADAVRMLPATAFDQLMILSQSSSCGRWVVDRTPWTRRRVAD